MGVKVCRPVRSTFRKTQSQLSFGHHSLGFYSLAVYELYFDQTIDMKLLFSMAYDGRPYKETTDEYRPVGPLTLLGLLERELGLFDFFPAPDERLKSYLDILLQKSNGTFFATALEKDPLNVAQELLGYRDELVEMGWRHSMENAPSRLQDLAAVENEFQQSEFCVGVPDRWLRVLTTFEKGDAEELQIESIILHDQIEHLPPLVQRVMRALGEIVSKEDPTQRDSQNNLGLFKAALRGDEPDRELAPLEEDRSLQLIRFNTQQEMCDAMAYYADREKHVFINPDNANFDYSLVSFGKAASGSTQLSANPMTIQLYKLIIPCITGKLNIESLLSLLQLRYSPIDRKLSSPLMHCLADKPGVGNPEWNTIIENYLSGEEEDPIPDESEKVRREKLIKLFLTFDEATNEPVKERAEKVLQHLQNWIQEKCKAGLTPEIREQFDYLGTLCKQTIQLIPAQCTTKEIEQIFQGVYESANFTNYQRQKNSVTVVSDFGAVASNTSKIVVALNFNDHPIKASKGQFLLHEEREFLKTHDAYYRPEAQINLQLGQWVRGISRTQNQLKLCFIEKDGVDKHPLHIRLESLFKSSFENISTDITSIQDDGHIIIGDVPSPAFESQRLFSIQEEIEALSGGELGNELKKIPRRPVESASSLERFIEYPLDWVLTYVALFKDNRGLSIPSDNLLLGNLAHKVVEILFTQHAIGQTEFNIGENDFNSVFDEVIRTEGATFLLQENRFSLSNFRYKLRKSIRNLQEIINENELIVEACEKPFGRDEDCIVDEALGRVNGSIDLLLKDKSNNSFVFDMKWTYSDKKYIEKIEGGAAIQLALYTAALNQSESARTGYFLLDEGKLITASTLQGNAVQNVATSATNSEVLNKLKQSLEFRWSELKQGRLEYGEDLELVNLKYHNEPDLIPLPNKDKKTKTPMPYTGYNFLKGTLQ